VVGGGLGGGRGQESIDMGSGRGKVGEVEWDGECGRRLERFKDETTVGICCWLLQVEVGMDWVGEGELGGEGADLFFEIRRGEEGGEE
jgi:hypothetical protein